MFLQHEQGILIYLEAN